MGEAILRHRLARAGVEAHVHSAGLMAGGVPASAGSVRAMTKRGFDLDAHRSQPLTPDLVAGADLVIGMAREHLREAVVRDPSAMERTFTLRELVRRASAAGPRRVMAPTGDRPPARASVGPAEGLEPFSAWLARIGAGRRAADLLGDDADDDVADPMGLSRRTYERTAEQIEGLVATFVGLAFPQGRSQPTTL